MTDPVIWKGMPDWYVAYCRRTRGATDPWWPRRWKGMM